MRDKGHNSGSTGGRPRKAEAERRDVRLSPVRVTAAELAHARQLADAAGLSLADFVRHRALGWRIPARTTATDDKALVALSRVAANLAQIVRAVNFGQGIPPDLAETLAEVKDAAQRITGSSD